MAHVAEDLAPRDEDTYWRSQSDDPMTRAAVAMLSDQRFTRILDIPSVPVVNMARVRYSRLLRTDQDGELWYVRSPGTDFVIIPRPWLSAGMLRCYSLGWGLCGRQQTDRLLLAQAFLDDAVPARSLGATLTAALVPDVASWCSWRVGQMWDRVCLWVAARLRSGAVEPGSA